MKDKRWIFDYTNLTYYGPVEAKKAKKLARMLRIIDNNDGFKYEARSHYFFPKKVEICKARPEVLDVNLDLSWRRWSIKKIEETYAEIKALDEKAPVKGDIVRVYGISDGIGVVTGITPFRRRLVTLYSASEYRNNTRMTVSMKNVKKAGPKFKQKQVESMEGRIDEMEAAVALINGK